MWCHVDEMLTFGIGNDTRFTDAQEYDPSALFSSTSTIYVYVADVDEVKKKVKLLSPQPGGIPANAMVRGKWPEDVPGLVG
jgi:hypothetical protein